MAVKARLTSALSVSIAVHAGIVAILLIWSGLQPEPVVTRQPPQRSDLVFIAAVGPGGGGGGSPRLAQPAEIEIPKQRATSIAIEPVAAPPVDPPPVLDVPLVATTDYFRGGGTSLLAPPGPGGGGRGPGAGRGDGPGVDDGRKGGAGGGPRGPGIDRQPVLIRQVRPAYTGAALAAKIQGTVTLEAEVLANGTVGAIKIIKSLDRVHGLDQEAIRAARQWLFVPAMAGGKPIDVIVQLLLDFNLR